MAGAFSTVSTPQRMLSRLMGLELHHACVLLSFPAFISTFVSNAVSVTLVP